MAGSWRSLGEVDYTEDNDSRGQLDFVGLLLEEVGCREYLSI